MKRSPLLVIFITVFIDLIGFGIVIPVLPFYAEGTRFNASPREVGLLFAAYSVMQLIFTPILGRLSDKYGRRPVLFLSLIGTGLGFLIMGFATTLWMLFAGRILDGITGGNISTAQAYISDVTTPQERAKGMGMLGAAFGLGFIFGPAIGGILSRYGISVPFFFAAALAFANAILLYFTLPETVTPDHPARTQAAQNGWLQMFTAFRQTRLAFLLVIYFLFIVAFSMMTTTYALFTMYRFGYDAQHNGYLFALVGTIAVVVQGLLIGRLVRRYGEMILIIAGSLMFALSLAATPFVAPQTGGLFALLLITTFFALGNSLSGPALTSLTSKSVGRGEQGGVLGVTQSAASLARALGPALGAFLIYSRSAPRQMDDRSIRLTFWVASAITFAAFLLALYFARMHRTAYAEAKTTSPVSS
jgi:DHA1 family tetracycline resistance protein-like MFS transporter